MRKFTKSLMTLALLIGGVTIVNAAEKVEKVFEKDWTAAPSYDYYKLGQPDGDS